jgi:hypothetical protein
VTATTTTRYFGIPSNGGYDGLVRRRNGHTVEYLNKRTGRWAEDNGLLQACSEGEFDRLTDDQAVELARSWGWPLEAAESASG